MIPLTWILVQSHTILEPLKALIQNPKDLVTAESATDDVDIVERCFEKRQGSETTGSALLCYDRIDPSSAISMGLSH